MLDRDTGAIVWQRQVGPGGQGGGMEWGSATDGEKLYVANTNSAYQNWTMVPLGVVATGGMLSALDPATERIMWQTGEPTGTWAFGPVSVAHGVVFAGAMDPRGHMRALDAADRKILWSFESGGSVASGPAIAGGMVFWGSGHDHTNSAMVHAST